MPTTPALDLPYPAAGQSDNVPNDMQQLAEATEAALRIIGGESVGEEYYNGTGSNVTATAWGTADANLAAVTVNVPVPMRVRAVLNGRIRLTVTSGTLECRAGIDVSGGVTQVVNSYQSASGAASVNGTYYIPAVSEIVVDIPADTDVTFTAQTYKAGSGTANLDIKCLRVYPIALL